MAVSSRFNARSTAMEVAAGHDLRDRTMIVTGGAGGLGLEAVRALDHAGATVIVTARDPARATRALSEAGLSSIEVRQLDLMHLASVRAFAKDWGDQPLDVLINNAGIMQAPQGVTGDGFEQHMGVNHLAHFLLTVLLTPALKQGRESRVVSVSSSAHRLAPWNVDDPFGEARSYDPHRAYGESKSANALFALAYDRRHAVDGVRAYSLMPGVIETPLMKHVPLNDRAALLERMSHAVKSPAQGASTIIWAAIAPELNGHGGLYLENCAEAPPADPSIPGRGVADHVKDPDVAYRLWDWSEEQIGHASFLSN